jgi:TRAP-type mannitol/chloroaromatic compound transport system permease small subunit
MPPTESPPSLPLRLADALSETTGRLAALCALLALLLMIGLVIGRLAGTGSVPLQDAVLWLNAAMVMLGLGYALKHGCHVRIDAFAARWSPRTRARVELLGLTLFLLPFCAGLFWLSLDYVGLSWQLRERSASTGGLPGLYLAKSLLPLGTALLALQGLAEMLRCWPRAFGGRA